MAEDHPKDAPPGTFPPLFWLLMALTFTTGLVDAVSFLALGHVFTANMTGNVVFLGFALAGEGGTDAARSVAALGAFMVGAVVGGRLARAASGATHRVWLTRVAVVEVALLVAASGCGLAYDAPTASPGWALYGILGLTAVAMGLRNATAIQLADPDVKTTVLTLTITGLAADSVLAGGEAPRQARRAASVFALGGGAAAGALLLTAPGGVATALAGMAAVVALATAAYVRHPASLAVAKLPARHAR